MSTTKVAITIDRDLLNRLDRLVRSRKFSNRSRAIQEAVSEKLAQMESGRLARECSKLSAKFEQAMADEGMSAACKPLRSSGITRLPRCYGLIRLP